MYRLRWTPVAPIQDLLDELTQLRRTNCGEFEMLDFSTFPTAPIPPDVDVDYPIWALDNDGDCLVGEDAAAIEPLETNRAYDAVRALSTEQ